MCTEEELKVLKLKWSLVARLESDKDSCLCKHALEESVGSGFA